MRIVLDAMGSDNCPSPEIEASIEAVRLFSEEIILTGLMNCCRKNLIA